jgi:predicted phage baseplate assembly protein
MTPTPAALSTCGCCGPTPPDPHVTNPPGLTQIAFRSGTHATVLRRMLGALDQDLPALRARGTDDPSTALLDAFATLADVVTFYQERIANEGFLRSATEQRSVLELARSIGYELRPGAAAATVLSFIVLPGEGAPRAAAVGAGLAVRSVPAQDQLPQAYETDDDLLATVTGNSVPLRQRHPQVVAPGAVTAYLDGVTTGLAVGDALLIVSGPVVAAEPDSARREIRLLSSVEPRPALSPDEVSTTIVRWAEPLTGDWPADTEVHALRLRASVFGHNAPDFRTMPDEVRGRFPAPSPPPPPDSERDWPRLALPDGTETDETDQARPVLHLDQAYPALRSTSWLVLREQPDGDSLSQHVCRVKDAQLAARTDFAMSSRTTRVVLDSTPEDVASFHRRAVVVLTASEPLTLASAPLSPDVPGPVLEVAAVAPFALGQLVVVTGTSTDGAPVTQLTHVEGVDAAAGTISLRDQLTAPLTRESVRVLANVVTATHGQTVPAEVLGDGDGTQRFQRFTLQKKELTHLTASTASGVESTLEVRVGGVLWHQVPSLFLAGPQETAYIVRIDDEARATVVFGDGEHGARLPTGQENVVARYRSGIGPVGDASAGALSLLQQRPLGITAVTNPLPAAGGTGPERVEDARGNAPVTVLTLDRVVSVEDHADFARAFVGVAKSRAVVLWDGTAPFVHVTVAAPDGQKMSVLTLGHLREAFELVRDRTRAVHVEDFEPLEFAVGVEVLADPTLLFASVEERVRESLTAHFALPRRDFAEPVTSSEVLVTVQSTPGVVAVRLTALYLASQAPGVVEVLTAHDAVQRSPETGRLRRHRPVDGEPDPFGADDVRPAQLLLLAEGMIAVTEMTP